MSEEDLKVEEIDKEIEEYLEIKKDEEKVADKEGPKIFLKNNYQAKIELKKLIQKEIAGKRNLGDFLISYLDNAENLINSCRELPLIEQAAPLGQAFGICLEIIESGICAREYAQVGLNARVFYKIYEKYLEISNSIRNINKEIRLKFIEKAMLRIYERNVGELDSLQKKVIERIAKAFW